jgi:hypothetical protein
LYIPYGYDTLLTARGKNVANYYMSTAYSGQPDLVAMGVAP